MFVALEGVCGVGKTTVAGRLAAALDAAWVPTVPPGYGRDRAAFTQPEHLDARYLYFLSAVSLAALDVRRQLAAGGWVVVESYFPRTIAFHRGMGSRLNARPPAGSPSPDVVFYLVCEEAERQRRLVARRQRESLWGQLAEQRVGRIDREYQAFAMHVIDTTARRCDDVVQLILTHPLDGRCNCANPQPLAGHPNLLSALRCRAGRT